MMLTCAVCGAEAADGARFCASCGSPLGARRESRKVVTVLFCDWVRSTSLGHALDVETVRRVQNGFFEATRRVVERHGGTVEKFIGDAVMAVFGIPETHEDDALRAVRAAVELREALASLNVRLERELGVRLSVRTGVNTGEVAAGDPGSGQAFVSGHAVVVAKRLEEGATPGEILIGDTTRALVRNATLLEPVEDRALKGMTPAAALWRVVGVVAGAPGFARRLDARLVDRERELALLRHAFDRARTAGTGQFVTILGPAGVGKSRLVNELLDEVGDHATVLRGRCLPYGEGITFWPLVDIVRDAVQIPRTLPPDEAKRRIEGLLADDPAAATVAERVAAAVGLSDMPASPEETFWAVRRLLESLARRKPLVLSLDDIHWGEDMFLDLVDYLGDSTRDAPIMVACLARPELLEARPTWGGGKVNAASILLDPLTGDESAQLIHNLLGEGELTDDVRRAIAQPAEGNPLFLEEILGMLLDEGKLRRSNGAWRIDGADEIRVPPTIQALVAARLDRLPLEERSVIETAAVMGKWFRQSGLAELTEDSQLRSRLQALVRRELIRPSFEDSGDPSFQFRHILIQDAAYESIPKERRADLHERFAAWAEHNRGDRAREVEEIIGYHLERAYRLRTELGQHDERTQRLAARAGRLLGATGARALVREDIPAAITLLERAATLLPDDPEQLSTVLLDQGAALRESGDLSRAASVLDAAIDAAAAAGHPHLRSRALVERSSLEAYIDPAVKAENLLGVVSDAIGVFERSGDELGLAKAWIHAAEVQWLRCRCAEMEEALDRALLHAERAGARRERSWALGSISRAALLGPRPVVEAVERCDWARALSNGDVMVDAYADSCTAVLETMRGGHDRARELYRRAQETLQEVGLTVLLASMRMYGGIAELIAGDDTAAERELRLGYNALDRMGERAYLSTMAGFLARALYGLGEHDEAEAVARVSADAASEDDIASQVISRGTRAKLLARRGDPEAESLARQAVAFAQETDFVNVQADANADLAETMQLLGRPDDALRALDEALRLYGAKGNVVSARAVRALVAAGS
jgi:class 3 adenylate cyclase/tetratricopeptide (TPR) repeat protein